MNKRARRSCLAFASMLALVGCGTQPEVEEAQPAPRPVQSNRLHSERGGIGLLLDSSSGDKSAMAVLTVDPRKSLAVTDQAIVSTFSLKEVLDQLVAQGGVPGQTSLLLYRQLWDTQNQKPGLSLGQHCNDVVVGNQAQFNTYPYQCPRTEGSQASQDPFNPSTGTNGYKALGLFNRFDLAPADGANCGEYRIVFARNGGGRNFMIFEAVLPNPNPDQGLEGCLPVADFWAKLSATPSVTERATALHTFYMQGLPGFRPVVHIDNYGANPATGDGQIRTNQFMGGNWNLREFKLQKTCNSTGCTSLRALMATDKVNPFGGLFNPTSTHARAEDFRLFFATQVEALANPDINLFNMAVQDQFNGGQSDAQATENNYPFQFGTGTSTLRNLITAELTRIGSTLTANQIVARAGALSCAGCHQLSNGTSLGGGLTWPNSLGFTHIAETTETGPDGPRFIISSALTGTFLPHRKAVFEAYLGKPRACRNPCSPGNRMPTTCSACTTTVCEGDPFCCTDLWDVICVEQAVDVCELSCG
ncbi:hypothetical protein LZ198_17700 [Myxococcus sp. K15C18031901]|uniref:hypothetical protein n=1 Tax=Myxococcus dinghuensis TaxID=2906761 RepID=UPI0020A6EBD0|nr:hypothetical protein [Myxococcus dinghuensis]MCP3100708.1 hypothetical protein [Myxococcus dinghuensis]